MARPGYVSAIRAAAARWPDIVAIEDASGGTTFADLVRRAETFGHDLAGIVPPGAVVGIRLPQGVDLVTSVLAARIAGLGVLMLDPRQPGSRDAALCADTDAAFVIGEGLGPEGPPSLPTAAVAGVQRIRAKIPGDGTVAFVLGTSGSTGRPKAVVHTDASMLSWGRAAASECGHGPGDVVLSMSSPATLGGFVGITTSLLSGATQRSLDMGARGLPALVDALRDGRVTSFRATPSLVRVLGSVPAFADVAARLVTLSLYGEPLTWDDVDAIRGILPRSCRVRVAYGSTEAGGCSWFLGERPEGGGKVHAGRPYAGVTVTVVGADGRPVPRGAEGEVVVGGTHNSVGTLVEGRLVPHAPNPHGLASGDLGRIRTDGGLEVLGRVDRAVKVNGVRIDLSEVEAVVRGSPGVSRAEVVASPRSGGCRIVAFVVLGSDGVTARDVERHARARLPGSTAPRVVAVDAMPTLSVGKLDVAHLTRMAESLP